MFTVPGPYPSVVWAKGFAVLPKAVMGLVLTDPACIALPVRYLGYRRRCMRSGSPSTQLSRGGNHEAQME